MATHRDLPEQFGRYRIGQKLGEGGMGTVYLAEDTQLGRRVALKVPHLSPNDSKVLERFYREARLAAGIDHPNICPVYDVGHFDQVPYFTMPFIQGTPLSRWVTSRQRVSVPFAVDLTRKLAVALGFMHERGLMHRDLKPSNVMLKHNKEPVIMDFGLARSYIGDNRMSTTGTLVGTPAYMAPEQINGDPQAMGPSCDIYSLGVIFFELLTGRLPYEASALMELFGQILYATPPLPSVLKPDLDFGLDEICLRAMAKKTDERYTSMSGFAAALEGWGHRHATPIRSENGIREDQQHRREAHLLAAKAGTYYAAAEYDRAIASFAQAISLWKKAEYHHGRGKAYAMTGRFDLAVHDYDEAIRLNPILRVAYLNRALLLVKMREYDKAIADYGQAIRLRPKSPTGYMHRARCFSNKGDHLSAIVDYTKALELDPQSFEAHFNRARHYKMRGEYREALDDYARATVLNPRSSSALNNCAWLMASCPDCKLRNGTGAIELATKACELSNWQRSSHLDTLAAALAEGGRFEEAAARQKQAVALAPDNLRVEYESRLEGYLAGQPYRFERP